MCALKSENNPAVFICRKLLFGSLIHGTGLLYRSQCLVDWLYWSVGKRVCLAQHTLTRTCCTLT